MSHPDWINRNEYPFEPHFLDLEEGRLHYVDEGQGEPIVMVHGTPTWSFLYRGLIRGLSRNYRVIAPDHLGFGLSDKLADAPYRPEDHARRLEALIDHLGLENLALVVHDFGGPIGLSYALQHPKNVRALVLFNTWMWSLRGDRRTERASQFLGGPIGGFLYKRLNFSPRVLLPALLGDKKKFPTDVHHHYLAPFPGPEERTAPWVLARELIDSSAWYDELWRMRERIAGMPALLLWGMKDPAFGEEALARWAGLFRRARIVRFPEAGHFVQEEEADGLGATVRTFLEELP